MFSPTYALQPTQWSAPPASGFIPAPPTGIPPRPWSGRAPGVCLDPSAGGSVTPLMDGWRVGGSALMKWVVPPAARWPPPWLGCRPQIRPWVLAPTVAQMARRRAGRPCSGGAARREEEDYWRDCSHFKRIASPPSMPSVLLSPFILHTVPPSYPYPVHKSTY